METSDEASPAREIRMTGEILPLGERLKKRIDKSSIFK
jgi:hypothetical protein